MNKEIRELIKEKAMSLGFNLVSFTDPEISTQDIEAYEDWLSKKRNADLVYMENASPRKDISEILPGVKTIITLATSYNSEEKPLTPGNLKIAKYAHGRDYHKFIKKRLKDLESFLRILFPEINTRSFVDAVPLLERSFAKKSGLGIIGKNSCLITKEFGSFVFLSEILCDINLGKDKLSNQDRDFGICGACSLCIDSCPVKAIISPGVIDATRCIAYHTIENKGEIPQELGEKIRDSKYLFGCDICQKVCPHNAFKPYSKDLEITKKIAGDQIEISKIENIKTEEGFAEIFKGSPLMRAKLKGLRRIIALHSKKVLLENKAQKQKTHPKADLNI
ncbi:MAG: tRNA epoxyqueuosine(34) reductase QueG [Candidatus Gracilibacteria bacterium]|nr:tRNA epoxyqueuosine(34) reductase QueG [Candidatus Gracilibacteria bacterium]